LSGTGKPKLIICTHNYPEMIACKRNFPELQNYKCNFLELQNYKCNFLELQNYKCNFPELLICLVLKIPDSVIFDAIIQIYNVLKIRESMSGKL
jgi:hypothetical protein